MSVRQSAYFMSETNGPISMKFGTGSSHKRCRLSINQIYTNIKLNFSVFSILKKFPIKIGVF